MLSGNEIIRRPEAAADAKAMIALEVHAGASPVAHFETGIVRAANENRDALRAGNHSRE